MSELSKKSRTSAFVVSGLAAAMVVSVAATGANAAPTPKPALSVAQKNAACAPTDGVTPTSIALGWIGPKTGAASANYVGSSQAAQLRVDQENAKGGVNGRKLTMKVYDDQSSPTSQVSAAQQAIQSDKVFGLTAQSSVTSMFPTLKDSGIPVTGFNNAAFGTDRNAFGVTGSIAPPGTGSLLVIQKLKDMGVTKMANINHASAGASASGNTTSGLLKLVPGITESLRIADEPQSTHDATSTALRIKTSGSDGAIIVGYIEGAVSIAQALLQQGVKLKGMSIVGLSDPSVLKTTGAALDGALGTTYGSVPVGVNRPAVRTFANGMKAAGLNPYSSSAPMGYLGADLLIRGIKEAGQCPTRALFIDKLRNVTNYDGNGLVPEKVSFKPGTTVNGNLPSCSWFMVAKGDQLIPDAKPTCGAKYVNTATGAVVQG
jgi:branched-chain amino acid transport system substrate-binding protein